MRVETRIVSERELRCSVHELKSDRKYPVPCEACGAGPCTRYPGVVGSPDRVKEGK